MPILSESALSVRADFPADFADDVPPPCQLVPAIILLIDLEYSPEAIAEAITHLGMFGTAECCTAIDVEHRAKVEVLLPQDVAWQSPEWDWDCWEPVS